MEDTIKLPERVDSAKIGNDNLAPRTLRRFGVAPVVAGEPSQIKVNKGGSDGEAKEYATLRELVADSEPYYEGEDSYYDHRLAGTPYKGKVPIGYAFIVVHHKVSKFSDLVGNITARGKSDSVDCNGLECAKCVHPSG